MKAYMMLDPTDIIQAGDEKLSQFAPFVWNKVPKNWIGMQVDTTIMRRQIVAPQWQTGRIPEPKPSELAVLVVQTVAGHSAATTSLTYDGSHWGSIMLNRKLYRVDELPAGLVHRWFIQPITLPVASGTSK